MRTSFSLALFLLAGALKAQNSCNNVAAYTSCEMTFELSGADAAAHPHPFVDTELNAEIRSPRFHTYLVPAFWDGHKLVIRFVPTEPGQWTYKLTGNLAEFTDKEGTFTATESSSPGYVHVANVHHWATDNKQAHLWMGTILDRAGFMPDDEFQSALDAAVQNKFNHIRCSILGSAADRSRVFSAGVPIEAYFAQLDRRVEAIHAKGLTTDLVLASDPDVIRALFPDWQSRERFVRYIVGRYGALNVTWQGVLDWEDFRDARDLLKELGLALKKIDSYDHPRSTNGRLSSSPLLPDGWMDFVIENSPDDQIAAVEHQFYTVPFVAVTTPEHLWNATMDGTYPEIDGAPDAVAKHWFEFLADTRHWELEPYFDLDGGRAIALDEIEYMVYIEKPVTPVEITVERHGYDVIWFNPATGESTEAKKYKGEHFTGDVPDRSHAWVLLVAREGRKESMLKSYKFESRPVPVQDVEVIAAKVPYEITAPMGDLIPGVPAKYEATIKKPTRATRSMMYVWTGEVAADNQGARILATGASGTLRVPQSIAKYYPALMTLHVTALNANGKAYSAGKALQVGK